MKAKKHVVTKPRNGTRFPKGYAKAHNPDVIQKYIREFNQLNNLKG